MSKTDKNKYRIDNIKYHNSTAPQNYYFGRVRYNYLIIVNTSTI